MNRKLLYIPCVLGVLSLSTFATAQDRGPNTPPAGETRPEGGPPPGDRPEGRPDGRPDGPPRDDNGGPNDRDPRGQRPDPQNGGGRPQSPQGAPAGGTNDVMRYQNYLNMVAQYSKMASDPESAGVAAVVSAADVLRRTGPQSAIDYFNKMLPDVKIEAVRRAIRLQLVDLYRAVKQDDKALDQLHLLITAETSDSPGKK